MTSKKVEDLMNNSNHTWKLNEKGVPDDFAYSYEEEESFAGHNGFECITCGYTFCEHCVHNNWEEFNSECK